MNAKSFSIKFHLEHSDASNAPSINILEKPTDKEITIIKSLSRIQEYFDTVIIIFNFILKTNKIDYDKKTFYLQLFLAKIDTSARNCLKLFAKKNNELKEIILEVQKITNF